jgi:hypothetical protein
MRQSHRKCWHRTGKATKNPSGKDGVVTTARLRKLPYRQYAEGGWQGLVHLVNLAGPSPRRLARLCGEMSPLTT